MPDNTAMATVSLHYWAGARAAAGLAEEAVEATSVAEALRVVSSRRADAHFDRVVKASAVLIDGLAAHSDDLDQHLIHPVRVEILPPFAGG